MNKYYLCQGSWPQAENYRGIVPDTVYTHMNKNEQNWDMR